jgi:hypothetical protein
MGPPPFSRKRPSCWGTTPASAEHHGCAIGARYRHMTSEMQARVLPVIEQHLATM